MKDLIIVMTHGKAAVAAGATLIHGIKDQWILSEILSAKPRSSH